MPAICTTFTLAVSEENKISMKINRFIIIFFICLISNNLHGQNKLQFSFECGETIKSAIDTKISLKFPNGNTSILYADSKTKYGFADKEIVSSKGEHILLIYLNVANYGYDSIAYNFELNGNEIETTISVTFDFIEQLIKNNEIYEKGDKIINGYVQINKYYNTPSTIKISIDKECIKNKYCNGIFFNIKNNSKDTIFGEHLPGYFWGTLTYLKNDSAYITRIGTLDYNFVNAPPLYPDSTKIATIGSFGLQNRLNSYWDYKFEVMLAKTYQSVVST